MIQRIQSIFLLFCSVTFWLLFTFPFAETSTPSPTLLADGVYNIFDHPVLLALTCMGGVLAVINIFLFKNRLMQIRIGYIILVVGILLCV